MARPLGTPPLFWWWVVRPKISVYRKVILGQPPVVPRTDLSSLSGWRSDSWLRPVPDLLVGGFPMVGRHRAKRDLAFGRGRGFFNYRGIIWLGLS